MIFGCPAWRVARKEAVIAKLTEQVAALEKENTELRAENAALRERIARLDRVISRNKSSKSWAKDRGSRTRCPRRPC
ncbi:cell division protein FtsB [Planotetraspora sp. GP83]